MLLSFEDDDKCIKSFEKGSKKLEDKSSTSLSYCNKSYEDSLACSEMRFILIVISIFMKVFLQSFQALLTTDFDKLLFFSSIFCTFMSVDSIMVGNLAISVVLSGSHRMCGCLKIHCVLLLENKWICSILLETICLFC
jgi:hypothetical protein